MQSEPVIGLNCSSRRNKRYAAYESFLLEGYYDSVAAAGGLPVILPPLVEEERVGAYLGVIDGLVVVGGDDINPARYGEELHEETRPVPPRREEFDLRLVAAALRRGVPLLAICLGCQVLNVSRGGTLHQHLPDVYGEDVPHTPTEEMRRAGEERWHPVQIERDTLLRDVLGAEALDVNSSHHQSVDRVGEGLRVSARAPDGVIEALEWTNGRARPFMLAVQWHPERIRGAEGQMLLFEALVRAARAGRAAGGTANAP